MVFEAIYDVSQQYRSQRPLGQELHDALLDDEICLADFPEYDTEQSGQRFGIDMARAKTKKLFDERGVDPMDTIGDDLYEALVSAGSVVSDTENAIPYARRASFADTSITGFRDDDRRDHVAEKIGKSIDYVIAGNYGLGEDFIEPHEDLTCGEPEPRVAYNQVNAKLSSLRNTSIVPRRETADGSTSSYRFSPRPTTSQGRGRNVAGGTTGTLSPNQTSPGTNYDFSQHGTH
jgi:hypothetical protein